MLKCKINQLLHCRGLEHQNWVNVILNVALTIWFTVTLLINSVMMGGERLFLFVFLCQRTPQEEGSPASGWVWKKRLCISDCKSVRDTNKHMRAHVETRSRTHTHKNTCTDLLRGSSFFPFSLAKCQRGLAHVDDLGDEQGRSGSFGNNPEADHCNFKMCA